MALNDFKDTNQGGGVLTVSNSNMGERLDWDAQNKKYNVNVSDILQTLTAHDKRLNALEGKEDGSIKFNSSSDLNHAIPKYGFSIMHGTDYVRGVPRNIYYAGYRQKAALDLADYSGSLSGDLEADKGINSIGHDWTGWQIANTSEIVQFIQEEAGSRTHPVNVWCRVNYGGLVLVDGKPKVYDPNGWTDWVRITNVA